ncbi:unnamed protein product [Lampetra fluviatilis]
MEQPRSSRSVATARNHPEATGPPLVKPHANGYPSRGISTVLSATTRTWEEKQLQQQLPGSRGDQLACTGRTTSRREMPKLRLHDKASRYFDDCRQSGRRPVFKGHTRAAFSPGAAVGTFQNPPGVRWHGRAAGSSHRPLSMATSAAMTEDEPCLGHSLDSSQEDRCHPHPPPPTHHAAPASALRSSREPRSRSRWDFSENSFVFALF